MKKDTRKSQDAARAPIERSKRLFPWLLVVSVCLPGHRGMAEEAARPRIERDLRSL